MSSIRVDRMWMYKRLVPSRTTVTSEFIEGVRGFIEFALMQPDFVSNGSIRCPCSKFKNSSGFLEPHDIRSHLYKHAFLPTIINGNHMGSLLFQFLGLNLVPI